VAICLNGLGKYAEALPLYKRPSRSGRNYWERTTPTPPKLQQRAFCLKALGNSPRPCPAQEGAQDQEEGVREAHPETAASYINLADACMPRDR